MGILLIDGEYYKKLYDIERLQEIVEKFIGIINYPSRIIYFGAKIEDSFRKKLNNVRNLEVNEKGYISTYDDRRRVQKGVDGYIVKDLILLSQSSEISDIYLMAGDGDLIAGIEYAIENGKDVKVISCKETTSGRIEQLAEVYHFQDYLKAEAVNEAVSNNLSENILILNKMWIKNQNNKGWLSSSTIGQERKRYNFEYKKLKVLLNQLEKKGIIEQQKELKGPGTEIRFKE